MNWYNVFYWVTRADSVKDFFDTASNIFTWFTVLSFIALVVCTLGTSSAIADNGSKNEEEDNTISDIRAWMRTRRYISYLFYSVLLLSLITWAGYMFIPTKKEALLIMAAGGTMQFLTTDSTAKRIPHEMSSFVVNELKSMAAEAKVDLGIMDQKDKIIDEAKKLSADELMNRMKSDSNFAKIILNQ